VKRPYGPVSAIADIAMLQNKTGVFIYSNYLFSRVLVRLWYINGCSITPNNYREDSTSRLGARCA